MEFNRQYQEVLPTPVVLSRPPAHAAVGALMYLLAAPVAAMFIGLFASTLFRGIAALFRISAAETDTVSGWLLLGGAVLTLMWCVRDFVRRASFQLSIFPNRLEVGGMFNKWSCSYQDVKTIQLIRRRNTIVCVIETDSGQRRYLPADVANRDAVKNAFNTWLIPVLVQRIEKQLSLGQDVDVRDLGWQAVTRMTTAIGPMLAGCLLFVRIHTIPRAMAEMRSSIWNFRQIRRGFNGGFTLSTQDLFSRQYASEVIAWTDLTRVVEDDAGIVAIDKFGRQIAASPYARNFWPASVFVATKATRNRLDLNKRLTTIAAVSKPSLDELVGIARGSEAPLTDEQVKQLIVEARKEKSAK